MPPAVEISLWKETTGRQQVQPQGGRFDTSADTFKTLNFNGLERSLRLLTANIISDFFSKQ